MIEFHFWVCRNFDTVIMYDAGQDIWLPRKEKREVMAQCEVCLRGRRTIFSQVTSSWTDGCSETNTSDAWTHTVKIFCLLNVLC
jgi:hypothetical protein